MNRILNKLNLHLNNIPEFNKSLQYLTNRRYINVVNHKDNINNLQVLLFNFIIENEDIPDEEYNKFINLSNTITNMYNMIDLEYIFNGFSYETIHYLMETNTNDLEKLSDNHIFKYKNCINYMKKYGRYVIICKLLDIQYSNFPFLNNKTFNNNCKGIIINDIYIENLFYKQKI